MKLNNPRHSCEWVHFSRSDLDSQKTGSDLSRPVVNNNILTRPYPTAHNYPYYLPFDFLKNK